MAERKKPGPPPGTRKNTVAPEVRLKKAERDRIIARRYRKGENQREIIRYLEIHKPDLACDKAQVSRTIKALFDELRKEAVADITIMRRVEGDRLNGLISAYWNDAYGEDDDGNRIELDATKAELVRKLIKDRRDLWGMDLPVKTRIEVTNDEADRMAFFARAMALSKKGRLSVDAVDEILAIYEKLVSENPGGDIQDAEFKEAD